MNATLILVLIIILGFGCFIAYFLFWNKDKTEASTESTNPLTGEVEITTTEKYTSTKQTEQPTEQWKSDIATIRKWVQFFGWLTIGSIIITIIATLSMMK